MTDQPLSFAAQAVLDATYQEMDYAPRRHVQWAAAAALKAAVKYTRKQKVLRTLGVPMMKSPVYCLESALLDIAAELEGK